MSTAEIILNQLKETNQSVLWSWGAHAYKAVSSQYFTDVFGNHSGALIFKSNGRLRKGHVAICLMPNDPYSVHFGSLRKGKFIAQKSKNNVFCDELMEVIDKEIENP